LNGDAVAHTVTADEGSWGSPLIEPGGMFQRTFDEPGRYTYHCVPHPFMKGVIVVEGGP
ncbi:MAG: plastocyanin, partial [Gemmatimonadetes bacterium]|nr:plastocyanin [Gemmatimonadota bacterium]